MGINLTEDTLDKKTDKEEDSFTWTLLSCFSCCLHPPMYIPTKQSSKTIFIFMLRMRYRMNIK